MKKVVKWTLVALIWLFALGCAYIGIIFVLFGAMMGPRGNIDFDSFTAARKQAAETQALMTELFGFLPLSIAALSAFFSVRIAKFVLRIWPDKKPA